MECQGAHGRRSQSTLESLAVLADHWSDIAALVDARPEGPWMYGVTEERLLGIELSK
jgi:hypothetical protein